MESIIKAILIVAIVAVVVGFNIPPRCKSCRRLLALKKTGGIDHDSLISVREEWKCKYCDHTTWTTKLKTGGGGA